MSYFISSNYGSGGGILAAGLKDEGPNHQNLIRLLEVATTLNVPILPLTWEPSFEALGPDGAVGRVNQSPFNNKMAFAFKRFNPQVTRQDLTLEEFRDLQYSAMISEIIVLSSDSLRKNPNVISLIGVAFELYAPTNDMFPVLVFIKASHRDLNKFISQNSYLAPEQRMLICENIAKGILGLHRCDIIHGDIKPGNTLVFQVPGVAAIEIQVTDFGFSSFNKNDDNLDQVARTEPWEAPEWHRNYFTLDQAKKMDVYSFGLLCLWVFFKDERLPNSGLDQTLHDILTEQEIQSTVKFKALKNGNKLLECIKEAVQRKSDWAEGTRNDLVELLSLCLDANAENRASMQALYDQFWGKGDPDEALMAECRPPIAPDWHGNFQIERFFFHFEPVDYRAHSHIAESLKLMAEGEGCDICTKNAAFQLAVCHSFGFGVTMDDALVQRWLDRSERPVTDLNNCLLRIKKTNPRAIFMGGLAVMGYRSNLLLRYSEDGILDKALDDHRLMVEAREEAFGPSHFSTLRIRGLFVDLLRWTGNLQEALQHATKNTENAGASVILEEQLTMKTQLANIHRDMGDLQTAESLEREIISSRKNNLPKNPTNFHDQTMLADLLVSRGKYDDAIRILEDVLQQSQEELGHYHATTIEAKHYLAAAYDANGDLQRAVDLGMELVQAKGEWNGTDDFRTTEDLCLLGIRLYRLGKKHEALGQYTRVKSIADRKPECAKFAVITAANYSALLMRRGNLKESISILENLLPESQKTLGTEHEKTIAIVGNLAAAYQYNLQLEQAEVLERRVLEARRKILSDQHPHTLTAFSNLRQCLFQQKKWIEAATIGKEELAIRDKIANTPNSVKLRIVSSIATFLTMGEEYNEALPYFKEEFSLREGEPNGDYDIVPAMMLAAACEMHINQIGQGRKRVREVMHLLCEPFKATPTILYDRLTFLVNACLKTKCSEEAKVLLAAGVDLMDLFPKDILPPNLETILTELEAQLLIPDVEGSELEIASLSIESGTK